MAENDFNFEDDGRYYTELAAAFVRGKIGGGGDLSPEELIGLGSARGLRLQNSNASPNCRACEKR